MEEDTKGWSVREGLEAEQIKKRRRKGRIGGNIWGVAHACAWPWPFSCGQEEVLLRLRGLVVLENEIYKYIYVFF